MKKETPPEANQVEEQDPETPYPSYCPPHHIEHEYKFGNLVLREFEDLKVGRAPIAVGFPTGNMGVVSTMTAKYIVKELNLPLIGDIVSKQFNPVTVINNGAPSHCCRIYGDERIVVFTSDCEYENAEVLNMLINSIYDFCVRHRSAMIICCDGLCDDPTKQEGVAQNIKIDFVNENDSDPEELSGEADDSVESGIPLSTKEELLELLNKATKEHEMFKGLLWFTTNDDHIASQLTTLGHKPVRNLILKGLCAGIISEMSVRPTKVVCLFAPLNKTLQIGTRASISIIHCMDSLINRSNDEKGCLIDTSNLNKTASEIDKSIIEAINKMDIMCGTGQESYSNMYM